MKTPTTDGRRRPANVPTSFGGGLRAVRAIACPPGLGGDGRRYGRLSAGHLTFPCAIGRGGMRHAKREGDGATPFGRLKVLGGFFRADRLPRPRFAVPLKALRRDDGWCDEPGRALYNRRIRLPSACGHEVMWRADGLYDVVLVLDYNIAPRRRGLGSAIFLHCARQDLPPTAGCIALRPVDFRRLLPRLARGCTLAIG